ncbi:MAG: hypothetical protein P8Y94_16735, partial [Acidobacteriota bacterium]
TWAGESNFSLRPINHADALGKVALGPMQIVYQIWNGNAEVVGDAFGENHSGGQTFNGSFLDNVRTAANILAGYISDYGVDSAAGYYRSGAGPWSNSRPGKIARAARQTLYDSLKEKYQKFFDCLDRDEP